MGKDCGCGGSSAEVPKSAAAGGERFALLLPNGTRMGDYPSRSAAELTNTVTFGGRASVVSK